MTCNFFSSTAFFRICFRSAFFVVLTRNELVNKGLQGKAEAGHEPLTFLPFQYKQMTGKSGKKTLIVWGDYASGAFTSFEKTKEISEIIHGLKKIDE